MRTRLTLLLLLSIGMAGCGVNLTYRPTVRGQVIDEHGAPIESAVVQVDAFLRDSIWDMENSEVYKDEFLSPSRLMPDAMAVAQDGTFTVTGIATRQPLSWLHHGMSHLFEGDCKAVVIISAPERQTVKRVFIYPYARSYIWGAAKPLSHDLGKVYLPPNEP